MPRYIPSLFFLSFFAVCAFSSDINLAPLVKYEEYSPVKDSAAYYLRICGPLLYSRRVSAPERTVWAVCPLFSTYDDEKSGSQLDILWPFGEFKECWYESRGRAIFYYYFKDKVAEQGSYSVVPFFTYDSGTDDGKGMTFFPVYGEFRKIFLYDKIYFVFFPLYVRTERGEVVESSFLWPFVSFSEGDVRTKFRIVPFYGVNMDENGSAAGFVMWPFFTYSSGADKSGGWMLWPFYGRFCDKNIVSWSTMWPMFEYSERATDSSLVRVDMFWPFFQYRNDFPYAGESRLYFWPFYGHNERGTQKKNFYMWPFFRTRTTRAKDGTVSEDIVKFWPFVTYESNADRIRFSFPDFWILDSFSAVERNWKPFWTFFELEQSSRAGRMECLWGMLSCRSGSDGRNEFSIAPFYSVRWNEGNTLTERDFLGGVVKVASGPDAVFCFKLFYCLAF